MSVNDQDLQLLEQSLDGELGAAINATLQQRIEADPELAQTLQGLREARQLRAAVFASFEPRMLQTDALLAQVRAGASRQNLRALRWQTLSKVTGIAAAIAMVFSAGWIGRSKLHVGSLSDPINLASPMLVVTNPSSSAPVGPPAAPNVNNSAALASYPRDQNGISKMRPTYKAYLVDPFNRVMSVRDFGNVDDPRQLSEQFASFAQDRSPADPAPAYKPPVLVDQPTH